MFTVRKALVVGLAAGALVAGLPLTQASAATATTSFSVTANVLTNCAITATNLDFGSYSGTEVDKTATLSATCSTGTPYTIGLNAGTAPAATVTTRAMVGPASDVLHYGLFRDAGHTQNWGNTPPTDTDAGTGTGAAQPY